MTTTSPARSPIRFEFDPQSSNRVILIGTTKNRQAIRLPRPMTRRQVQAAIGHLARGLNEPAERLAHRVAIVLDAREHEAWRWARDHQGFAGPFGAWLALPVAERQAYEAGAAGVPTA